MAEHDLDAIYREAQSALKSRDYIRASELLRQILVIDENYKDVSRLLAQTVKLKRRRWYNDPRLWGAVGVVAIIAVGIVLAPKVSGLLAGSEPTKPTVIVQPTSTVPPTDTSIPTEIIAPAPTPIPLTWKRVNIGQDFARDTVTAIAIDPKDPDVLYAGTENAGIYKSIDGGQSWRPALNGLGATRIDSLVIDPSNPRTLFAGVLLDDVYKSTDGGEHWQKTNVASQSASISQVVMDPNDSLHLLYLSDQIHETTDGGQTWQTNLISGCPQDIQNLILNPADALILYASDGGGSSCDAGVYKSNDGGKAWSLVGLKGEKIASGALQIDKQTGNTLYAAVEIFPGFRSSTNGGETWQQHSVYICSAIVIHPTDSKTVYCMSGGGLEKTIDGGKTWGKIETHGGSDHIVTLALSPQNPDILYLGRKGLFKSTNGVTTWAEISNGLGNNPVSLIVDTTQNANLYALDSSCVFRKDGYFPHLLHVSSDGGKTWNRVMHSRNTPCSPTFDVDGVTQYGVVATNPYSGAQGDSAYRSKNGWENPQKISPAGWFVFSIATNPHQAGNLLVTFYSDNPSEGNIALSTDGGVTWESISQVNWRDDSPAQFFFDHNSGQVIYAVPKVGDIYRSEDGGRTWGTCGQASILSYGYDSPLAIDLSDSSRGYLATRGKGILISADGCQTWQPSGLSDVYVNTVAIDPNNPETLYAGTDGGAFVSLDSGTTWNQINDGLLGATVVYSIAVDKDGNVYAATPYGVFKLESK
jgi:photosystem II stability/assembly factor-like uncharacterized protein